MLQVKALLGPSGGRLLRGTPRPGWVARGQKELRRDPTLDGGGGIEIASPVGILQQLRRQARQFFEFAAPNSRKQTAGLGSGTLPGNVAALLTKDASPLVRGAYSLHPIPGVQAREAFRQLNPPERDWVLTTHRNRASGFYGAPGFAGETWPKRGQERALPSQAARDPKRLAQAQGGYQAAFRERTAGCMVHHAKPRTGSPQRIGSQQLRRPHLSCAAVAEAIAAQLQ